MAQYLKYFTLQEAESILPAVADKMRLIRALKFQTDDKIAQWQSRSDSQAETSPVDEVLIKSQINFIVTQINREIESLQKLGCVMKDIEQGLVDFPTKMEGIECFLCWRLGEKKIGFWHGATEGLTGRKPIVRTAIHK